MQKYLEESNISKENFEVIKSVNKELQNNVEKLQKEIDKKQKILESLTQGKENLNTIIRSKINFNKERLGYLPKIKKKYDVKVINFVPQQKVDISPLIKMNCIIPKKPNKNLIIKINEKEKGKENLGENKINQIRSKKNKKNKVKFESKSK